MGQLLAAQNLLVRLSTTRQVGEFAAHALRSLPGARSTAARLADGIAAEGDWSADTWESLSRLLDATSEAFAWHDVQGGEVLVLPVASLRQRHGWVAVLAPERAPLERYLPFLANFAQNLALALENQQQRAELEAATRAAEREQGASTSSSSRA